MRELLPVTMVLAVAVFVFYVAQRGLERRREVPVLGLVLFLHVAGAFAQVLITEGYYGGGDALFYHRQAQVLGYHVTADAARYFPEILRLVVQLEARLPVYVIGAGGPTGTMQGLTTLLSIPLQSSVYAISVAYSLAAFVGFRALYQVFRERFEAKHHPFILLAVAGLPSVVFWTSGILKEAVAMAFLGWMVLGAHRLSQGRWVAGGGMALVGIFGASLVKGYIVLVFLLAGAVLIYWHRAVRPDGTLRGRPVYFVGLAVIAVVAVIGFGRIFPRYSFAEVIDETHHLQVVGIRASGGSNYELGRAEQTLLSQAALAPFALVTVLFRPLPFEAPGATGAVNAAETLAVTLLVAWVLYRQKWRDLLAMVRGSPFLMASVVFILLGGVGIGLATTNLGTLSRYRVPLMPFIMGTLVVLYRARPVPLPSPRGAAHPARRPVRGSAPSAPLDTR